MDSTQTTPEYNWMDIQMEFRVIQFGGKKYNLGIGGFRHTSKWKEKIAVERMIWFYCQITHTSFSCTWTFSAEADSLVTALIIGTYDKQQLSVWLKAVCVWPWSNQLCSHHSEGQTMCDYWFIIHKKLLLRIWFSSEDKCSFKSVSNCVSNKSSNNCTGRVQNNTRAVTACLKGTLVRKSSGVRISKCQMGFRGFFFFYSKYSIIFQFCVIQDTWSNDIASGRLWV